MKPGSRRSGGTYGYEVKLSARRRAIKAAWRVTGLDDDAYRTMLQAVAGVTTSTQLDLAGANLVLNHINKSTGRTAHAHTGKPDRMRPECTDLARKIEALLADMKLPWKYGLTILKHNGADAWAFATAEQLRNVIAALTVEQDKRQCEAAVVAALAAIGRERSAGELVAKALGAKSPATWHRNRDLMHRMLTHLKNVANAGAAR
jgi:phage gp16-like protein